AAAVAGKLGDMQLPKGLMLTIGTWSLMLAAGWLPVLDRWIGSTPSWLRAMPLVHFSAALFQTGKGMSRPSKGGFGDQQPSQVATKGAPVIAASLKLLACGENFVGAGGAAGGVVFWPPSLVMASLPSFAAIGEAPLPVPAEPPEFTFTIGALMA